MWQRFTERARRVILLAQNEAVKKNSAYLDTEHLLLGLLREKDAVGVQMLSQIGVSLEVIEESVEKRIAYEAQNNSEPRLTAHAKRVLELAADESWRMKLKNIGTEHLLLALLREKNGVASAVLHEFGADLVTLRKHIVQYHASQMPPIPSAIAPEKPSIPLVFANLPKGEDICLRFRLTAAQSHRRFLYAICFVPATSALTLVSGFVSIFTTFPNLPWLLRPVIFFALMYAGACLSIIFRANHYGATVCLQRQGLLTTKPKNTKQFYLRLCKWKQIHTIREINGDFCFCGWRYFILVPREAFRSKDEAQQFLEIAQQIWKSNGTQWPENSSEIKLGHYVSNK